jgi:hypothetical protein
LGLALAARDDDVIIIDGQSGNPATTRVAVGARESVLPNVPLIDPHLFWQDGDLIVAGFDCPDLDPEALVGETKADCGTLTQSVIRVDLTTAEVTIIARSISTEEVAPGPLVGDTLLLDGGGVHLDIANGDVTTAEPLPTALARCGSGGGLIELTPTNDDSPGSMAPDIRVRATVLDPGAPVRTGLPWGQSGIGGVAGCTADGLAVYVPTDDDVVVYNLTRSGEGANATRLAGPGLGPDWSVGIARDGTTLVAARRQGSTTERQLWVGDRWTPIPETNGNPVLATATTIAVVAVSGDATGATIAEFPT